MAALTKDEVLAQLQKEVQILRHLASKIDRSQLDYRPTPKQRSTIELLRYLVAMGPALTRSIKAGAFDVEHWQARTGAAEKATFDEVLGMIEGQSDEYARLLGEWSDADFRGEIEMFGRKASRAAFLLELVLGGWSDADFRGEIEMFGRKASRGAFLLELVLAGCAAYRTQLFCYLKSCGRDELTTMNLWQGIDTPAAV